MKCPNCNEERGCTCTWEVVPEQPETKICSICAENIRKERIKNDPATRVISIPSVPVQRRSVQDSQSQTLWHQTLPGELESGTASGTMDSEGHSQGPDE